MPTIGQLPALSQVDPADEIPLSHGGTTQSVSVGTLLAGAQPAIQAPTGALLGRVSVGTGGPEAVVVGTGLILQDATLGATGADHASFPTETTLQVADQAVISSGGAPKLLELALLRGLFSAGTNVAIDSSGTISVASSSGTGSVPGSSYSITELPTVTTIGQTDLVGISQSGNDHSITYQNFLDGQTIDEAQAAAAVSSSDTTWVAQGSSTMVRQTFAAIWSWIESNFPSYKAPVVEIVTSTNLDTTVHNGRLLLCSQPVTLTPIFANMGAGFACCVINLSNANVTLGAGIVTSTGSPALAPGQSCSMLGLSYSAGNVIYASMSAASGSSSVALPGTATALTLGGITSSGILLSWAAPSSGGTVSAYTVQYRVTGTTTWLTSSSSTSSTNDTITGLQPTTSYDLSVLATNASGVGPLSSIVTGTTSAASGIAPGQVSGVSVSSITSNSVTLTWVAPSVGTAPISYAVTYCPTGSSTWSIFASGVNTTTATVTGLSASSAYGFQVTASNAAGSGSPSATVQQTTSSSGTSVTAVVWNMVPSGSYAAGSGSIGVNAHITPTTAPVQFGFSTSSTVPPTGWTAASNVNTDLWGAYVNIPATRGTWFAWAEGLDGSAPTVLFTSFTVD